MCLCMPFLSPDIAAAPLYPWPTIFDASMPRLSRIPRSWVARPLPVRSVAQQSRWIVRGLQHQAHIASICLTVPDVKNLSFYLPVRWKAGQCWFSHKSCAEWLETLRRSTHFVLSARCTLHWRRLYLNVPSALHHYMTSSAVEQRGGFLGCNRYSCR